MLGIRFWDVHRPYQHVPADSIFQSASRARITSIALAALMTVAALAMPSHPAQFLILALAGAGILFGHRDLFAMASAVPASSGASAAPERWRSGNAAPAGRLTSPWAEVADSPGIDAQPSPAYAIVKRIFDLVAAALVALVTLPLFPLIALAIRIDSPGTVFYKQDRVGQNGQVFRIYKFRTMRTDAERNGAVWAMEGDPRITRVGNLMRRSRLDELPQLLNVLRGEMTFVGPRPERPEFTSVLERELPGYAQRHLVKPGLTGWAQVRYRYASSIQDTATKLEYDLYYVRHRSLRFDARILFQTIPMILHLQGR